MTRYRRDFTVGGTYFFTVNLAERRSSLLVDGIAELRAAFRLVRSRHPFTVNAIVVLPDHLHTIWTLPQSDADYPLRWRLIKAAFSRTQKTNERRSPSRLAKGERGIWQRRYWEHRIRDERDFAAHVDYIHINPMKHGLVGKVRDWRWSSFHRYARAGILSRDWAGESVSFDKGQSFGER